MPESQILVLVAPRELEDDLVDCLMGLDYLSGFNLGEISGYSREHSYLSLAEQVRGHRILSRFEIMHLSEDQQRLLQALGQAAAGMPLKYWLQPLLAEGHLGA